VTSGLSSGAGVLFFAAHKRPYFVALNALALQISHGRILILGADLASVNHKVYNGVDRRIRQPGRCAKAVPLNNAVEDLRSFLGVQFVHACNMLARASNVNGKI
jgi:hypothetical protein